MTKTNIAFSIAALFTVCFLSFTNGFAQSPKTQVEPSFEVILQTVVGSNNSTNKTDFPQNLSGTIKKLKANFSYSNYRLTSTFLQRTGNSGTILSKNYSNGELQNQETNYPTFSEWTLSNLQNLPDAGGQNSFQFQSLSYGQRVPVTVQTTKDENGKTNSVINYEQIGLTLQRFSLAANAPTVVGTVSTSKPDELMFLILTVRPAGE